MRTRSKWIAGFIAISLFSALAASLLTTALLMRSLMNSRSSHWLAFMAGLTEQTGRALPSDTSIVTETPTQLADPVSPQPTKKPTTVPTPSATPTPIVTPAVTPSLSPAPPAEPTWPVQQATERLYLWQIRQMVQDVYAEIAPAVVRILVVVPASGMQTARTNEASGLIIDEKGLIVTDASVMEIALDKNGRLLAGTQIEVVVRQTESILTAAYLGRDYVTGVAALQIEDTEISLAVPRFASSPSLRVGQMILSVGFPDLMMTEGGLASGFISALNRTVMLEDGTPVQMIQTDLQITASDAGGPLLNLQGEVIGLASCGLVDDPLDRRLYALPIDALLRIARALDSATTHEGRAWLGITVLSESSFLELQRLYRFPDGLYISSVIQDSPAYVADLRRNDIIVQINEEPVTPSMDLSSFLQEQPVGTALRLRVFRRSENRTVDIVTYLQETRP